MYWLSWWLWSRIFKIMHLQSALESIYVKLIVTLVSDIIHSVYPSSV